MEYDVIGNYLRNKCKYIIFSFHNCPEDIYQEFEIDENEEDNNNKWN